MSECTTQADVFENFARISRLAEEQDIPLNKLYKHEGYSLISTCITLTPENYSFAVAVLEGKGLFIGDTVYLHGYASPFKVLFHFPDTSRVRVHCGESGNTHTANVPISRLSWNHQVPKVLLEGKELCKGDVVYVDDWQYRFTLVDVVADGDTFVLQRAAPDGALTVYVPLTRITRVPPKPTFKLNGVTLPCPDTSYTTATNQLERNRILNFGWATQEEAEQVVDALHTIFSNAFTKGQNL